jgi:histone H3
MVSHLIFNIFYSIHFIKRNKMILRHPFNNKMKEKSFKVYIIRLLKSVHPGVRLTKSAVEAIDSILRVISDKIVDRALVLTTGGDKKTVSDREIQSAVKMVFPEYFGMNAVDFSIHTIDTYQKSEVERQGQPVEKAQTRESRCGLIFSVSAAEKYTRRFGQVALHVSSSAPVALASILEYFSRHLLEKTGDITKNSKKITINVRHLFLAVATDSVLPFVNNLGIVFLEGGVQPQDIQKKQHKRIRRVKNDDNEEEKTRTHRWRPGTKTVMQIRRLQKTGDLLMQRAPFNTLVRELISRYEQQEQTRLTADFCLTLQAFIEDRMVNLMRSANLLAVHASRETVYSRDVELACELTGEPIREQNFTSNIPEAALRQMALRAGVKRFGDCSTHAYRNYFVSILNLYLRDIVLCAQHHKIQTLNTKVLLEAMGMRGIYPSITPHKRKTGKKSISRTNSKVVNEESIADEAAPELSDIEEPTPSTAE